MAKTGALRVTFLHYPLWSETGGLVTPQFLTPIRCPEIADIPSSINPAMYTASPEIQSDFNIITVNPRRGNSQRLFRAS